MKILKDIIKTKIRENKTDKQYLLKMLKDLELLEERENLSKQETEIFEDIILNYISINRENEERNKNRVTITTPEPEDKDLIELDQKRKDFLKGYEHQDLIRSIIKNYNLNSETYYYLDHFINFIKSINRESILIKRLYNNRLHDRIKFLAFKNELKKTTKKGELKGTSLVRLFIGQNKEVKNYIFVYRELLHDSIVNRIICSKETYVEYEEIFNNKSIFKQDFNIKDIKVNEFTYLLEEKIELIEDEKDNPLLSIRTQEKAQRVLNEIEEEDNTLLNLKTAITDYNMKDEEEKIYSDITEVYHTIKEELEYYEEDREIKSTRKTGFIKQLINNTNVKQEIKNQQIIFVDENNELKAFEKKNEDIKKILRG